MNENLVQQILQRLPQIELGGFDLSLPVWGGGGILALAWLGLQVFNAFRQLFAPKPPSEKTFIVEMAELKAAVARLAAAPDGTPVEPQVASGRDAAVDRIVTRGLAEEIDALREFARGEIGEGLDDLFAQVDDIQNEADRLKAEKLRDIGILALSREPGRALDAYRRATTLDGSDFWAWVYLARLEQDWAGNVGAAGMAAQGALDAAGDDRERGIAADTLANVQVILGDLAGATENFGIANQAMRALSASDTENAGARRDVIVSLDKLGDLTGDKAHCREALEIAEAMEAAGQLSPSDAGVPDYLRAKIAGE